MQLGAEGRYQGKLSLVAEVGDVVSPGAPEVGHWFVPVAATKASVRGPGGAWALEKEGLFLCPCLAASRKANQGLRGHWTKCQPTPIGGQLPKDSQPLTQLFPIISFLALACGLAWLFYSGMLPLLPQQKEGASNPALCHAPQLGTCMRDELCASSFSVHGASREAGP